MDPTTATLHIVDGHNYRSWIKRSLPLIACFSVILTSCNGFATTTSSKDTIITTSLFELHSTTEVDAEPSNFDPHQFDDLCALHDPLEVLYENESILVINKPSGIPHHNEEKLPGILTLTRYQIEKGILPFYQSQQSIPRLYGVHRLDKVTSGILVFAKEPEIAHDLINGFQSHSITKYYTGLSCSKPKKKKQGLVQGWLVRGRRKSWLLTKDDKDGSGVFAKTRFYSAGLGHLTPSEKLFEGKTDEYPKTLILFRPFTGRTHQLRVSAKSVGLPLTGDPIYSKPYPLRTCLHATALILPGELVGTNAEALTIFSHPPFANLFVDSFDECLQSMFAKHCSDIPALQKCVMGLEG